MGSHHGTAMAPEDAEPLRAELPDTLGGLALPPPRALRRTRRAPAEHHARLTLGAEQAREEPRYWGRAVTLPTLTLRFVYDGHEVGPEDGAPTAVTDEEIVTLERDAAWEAACATRLMEAGALPVEELETLWPSERLLGRDFTLAAKVVSRSWWKFEGGVISG